MATKTSPRQLERVKLRNEAYKAAIARLIANHRAEWLVIYREEATDLGIKPRNRDDGH